MKQFYVKLNFKPSKEFYNVEAENEEEAISTVKANLSSMFEDIEEFIEYHEDNSTVTLTRD